MTNCDLSVQLNVIRTLAEQRNWSKHKVKSIRGQVLALKTFEERELYLKKLIKTN